MHAQARETLAEIRQIQRLETYVCCARAELASDPGNELLREFIRLNEALVRKERARLGQLTSPGAPTPLVPAAMT